MLLKKFFLDGTKKAVIVLKMFLNGATEKTPS